MYPVMMRTRSQTKLAAALMNQNLQPLQKKRTLSIASQQAVDSPIKKRTAFVDITNANQMIRNNEIHDNSKPKPVIRRPACEEMVVDDDSYQCPSSGSSSLYTTADESQYNSPAPSEEQLECDSTGVWPGVEDFDKEHWGDPYIMGHYAMDIFKYLRERETLFRIPKYLETQPELTKTMRSILVNWLVELQDGFQLNHEPLYLAVKIFDLYLSKKYIEKTKVQLLGATALLVASKYDDRCPPPIEEYLHVCDDLYTKKEMLQMEVDLLKTVGFNLGIPLSYSFLRRYAQCAKLDMELLTLARYVLELSLTSYDLIGELDSLMAAGSLLVALKMKNEAWSKTLHFYTEYAETELTEIARRLNKIVKNPKHGNVVVAKYSHRAFFHVADFPTVDF